MPIIPIIRSGGSKPSGKITITENGTGIDVAQYAEADVAVQGDFSTCTITFAGTEGDTSSGYCATIDDGTAVDGSYSVVVGNAITAVLYKGNGFLSGDHIESVSGNATFFADVVHYTGDCTITIGSGGK